MSSREENDILAARLLWVWGEKAKLLRGVSAPTRGRTAAGIVVTATLLLLVALALLPDIGWLVRTQWHTLFSPRPATVALREWRLEAVRSPDPAWLRGRLAAVARQHPDDYLLQLAWTLEQEHPSRVDLRPLLPRFGNRPALLAHILRYDTAGRVRIQRSEEWAFAPAAERPNPASLTPPSAQHLRAYEQIAERGERVDPENAYFPLMRAIGLFAARRDKEAMEAIRRASRKPRWDDYLWEEKEARLHLVQVAFGEPLAISQFLNGYSVPEAHWLSIPSLGRMVRYLAHTLERRGKAQQAADLRLAMLRCASRIRSQSSSSVGSLVALATASVATAVPSPPRSARETEVQYRERLQREFLATLRRLGREADARWAQQEFHAMEETHALLREGTSPRQWLRMPLRWVRAWTANLLWLWLLIGTALLWGVYAVAARTALQQGLAPYGVLLVTVSLAGGAVLLSPAAEFPTQVLAVLAYMVQAEGSQPEFVVIPPLLARVAAAALVSFLLLMLGTLVGVWGMLRGAEPNQALVEGMRRSAPFLIGLLAALYTLSLVHTTRLEGEWQRDLQAWRQHEGKFYAAQLGKRWLP